MLSVSYLKELDFLFQTQIFTILFPIIILRSLRVAFQSCYSMNLSGIKS